MLTYIIEILIFAVIVEAIIKLISPLFEPVKFMYPDANISYVMSIGIAVLMAVTLHVNCMDFLFSNVTLAEVTTGLFIARISNYIHNKLGKETKNLEDLMYEATLEQGMDD